MEKCCRTCHYFKLGYCTNEDLPITTSIEVNIKDGKKLLEANAIELDNTNGSFYITNPTDFCCSKYE